MHINNIINSNGLYHSLRPQLQIKEYAILHNLQKNVNIGNARQLTTTQREKREQEVLPDIH